MDNTKQPDPRFHEDFKSPAAQAWLEEQSQRLSDEIDEQLLAMMLQEMEDRFETPNNK